MALWLVVLVAPVVFAQSGSASYGLHRHSIDGGAGRSGSATYTLNATVGQPDAGPALASPSYRLRGGFHAARLSSPPTDTLFRDGFEP